MYVRQCFLFSFSILGIGCVEEGERGSPQDNFRSSSLLQIQRIERVPDVTHLAPRSVKVGSDSTLWGIAGADGRVFRVGRNNQVETIGSVSDSGFTQLVLNGSSIHVARDRQISEVERANHLRSVFALPDSVLGTISAFTKVGDRFWIITWFQRRAALVIVTEDAGQKFRVAVTVPLDDAAVIENLTASSVLVSLMRRPYTLLEIDTLGVVRWTARPSEELLVAEGLHTGKSATFTQSVMSLDRAYALQVITDLHTDQRWFALYRRGEAAAVRLHRLNAPIGFTGADTLRKLLVGFDDSPGRRGITLYGWMWNSTNQEFKP